MAQIDNHLTWCLKDPSRLKKAKPDNRLAQEHLKKSEYNADVMKLLEKGGKYDWALNVGFYAIIPLFFGYTCKVRLCTKKSKIFCVLEIFDFYEIQKSKLLNYCFD